MACSSVIYPFDWLIAALSLSLASSLTQACTLAWQPARLGKPRGMPSWMCEVRLQRRCSQWAACANQYCCKKYILSSAGMGQYPWRTYCLVHSVLIKNSMLTVSPKVMINASTNCSVCMCVLFIIYLFIYLSNYLSILLCIFMYLFICYYYYYCCLLFIYVFVLSVHSPPESSELPDSVSHNASALPGPPSKPEVTDVTKSSVSLSWQPGPEEGSQISSYVIEAFGYI